MSLDRTKKNFIKTLAEKSNKVVALSGKWGTGKSHLWKDVQKESNDKKVETALYVSLFGVSSLTELKLKVAQGVLIKPEAGRQEGESVKSFVGVVKKLLPKVHPSFSALDELALIAVPLMLKGRFIVIDDIERKHEKLSIDEILGFIDNCVQMLDCRILLILNSDQLGDRKIWELFREKVIDQELRLDTSPSEAFDIAVEKIPTKYAAHVRPAVEACKITNIRIVLKIIKVINRLFEDRTEVSEAVRSRVIPSATLLSAIHYKGLEDGPDFDFVLDYKNSSSAWGMQGDVKPRGKEDVPDKSRARWRLLLENLGVRGADAFEALVVEYLKSGLIDDAKLSTIIDRYTTQAETLEAENRRFEFYEKLVWHPQLSERELLDELRGLVPHAALNDMYTITELHNQAMNWPGGEPVAKELIASWIAAFQERQVRNPEHGFSTDFPLLSRPVHPDIERALRALKPRLQAPMTILEVCRRAAEGRGLGAREAAVMKDVTSSTYEAAIAAARGSDLKLLLRQSLLFVSNRDTYEPHFGGALDAFVNACRSLCRHPEVGARWEYLLTGLFREVGAKEI